MYENYLDHPISIKKVEFNSKREYTHVMYATENYIKSDLFIARIF